ncbi:unnamed protein product [Prorocentrum cordatum]|uniref:Uncharacterized protein n=1 Tax=Prorocentrum cordatum TaxID=2364126 RepID=A0ABN9VI75_9DINO|nr:unnamed protein product [Polarella glacialis]
MASATADDDGDVDDTIHLLQSDHCMDKVAMCAYWILKNIDPGLKTSLLLEDATRHPIHIVDVLKGPVESDLIANYHYIKGAITAMPDKIPSVHFLADVLRVQDHHLQGDLLRLNRQIVKDLKLDTKDALAIYVAGLRKRCLQYSRSLLRGSKGGPASDLKASMCYTYEPRTSSSTGSSGTPAGTGVVDIHSSDGDQAGLGFSEMEGNPCCDSDGAGHEESGEALKALEDGAQKPFGGQDPGVDALRDGSRTPLEGGDAAPKSGMAWEALEDGSQLPFGGQDLEGGHAAPKSGADMAVDDGVMVDGCQAAAEQEPWPEGSLAAAEQEPWPEDSLAAAEQEWPEDSLAAAEQEWPMGSQAEAEQEWPMGSQAEAGQDQLLEGDGKDEAMGSGGGRKDYDDLVEESPSIEAIDDVSDLTEDTLNLAGQLQAQEDGDAAASSAKDMECVAELCGCEGPPLDPVPDMRSRYLRPRAEPIRPVVEQVRGEMAAAPPPPVSSIEQNLLQSGKGKRGKGKGDSSGTGEARSSGKGKHGKGKGDGSGKDEVHSSGKVKHGMGKGDGSGKDEVHSSGKGKGKGDGSGKGEVHSSGKVKRGKGKGDSSGKDEVHSSGKGKGDSWGKDEAHSSGKDEVHSSGKKRAGDSGGSELRAKVSKGQCKGKQTKEGYAIPNNMPSRAYPQSELPKGLGGSSYTLAQHENGSQIKVLLHQKAFWICKTSNGEPPQQRHITWSKHGGIKASWDLACSNSGYPQDHA